MRPEVDPFFHPPTQTWSYVVHDPGTRQAAVVDPVLDYDPKSGRTGTSAADEIARHVERSKLRVAWILETHAHADHLTAANHLKCRLGGRVAIGQGITKVQSTFKPLFNLGEDFSADGSQFDHLFEDGEEFCIGELTGRVLATPGHTSDSVTYVIGDVAFIGDTMFAPDYGTARCDFPGGDARQLYHSIQRIFSLPGDTRLYLCHDYPPEGRAPLCEVRVADQRAHNVHVRVGIDEHEFAVGRNRRDVRLEMPTLMIPAIQINIRAGAEPPPEGNGVAYLKIPLNAL